MVIGPGRNGISAFVILGDGEFLTDNLNTIKTVVFRKGKSTDYELKMVKAFGKLADPSILRAAPEKECIPNEDGDPIHQHTDGGWWFFEKNFKMETGPYESWDEAFACLKIYCEILQEVLAEQEAQDEANAKDIPGEDTDRTDS